MILPVIGCGNKLLHLDQGLERVHFVGPHFDASIPNLYPNPKTTPNPIYNSFFFLLFFLNKSL